MMHWILTRIFARVALAASLLGTGAASAQEAKAVPLLQDHKCYICHSNDEAKAGPAYIDVAAKYRGNPKAMSIVATTVRNGAHGGGPWHMPPHPEISQADARIIARYILSLR
jgi:cytochrome c